MHPILLNAAGHRRQPVTLPGYHAGRPPRNKGRRYAADPPTVEEIIAVVRARRSPRRYGNRLVRIDRRAVACRATDQPGALAPPRPTWRNCRGAVLVRHGLCRIRHRPCYAGAMVMPSLG